MFQEPEDHSFDNLTKATARQIIETLQPEATPDQLTAVQHLLTDYLAQCHEQAKQSNPELAELQAQIEKLLVEISAVGDGDLRVSAEVTPDTVGVVADSFNYMIEEMARLVAYVQAICAQATPGNQHLLEKLETLLHAGERQSHLTERVSSMVTEGTLTAESAGPVTQQLLEVARQMRATIQEALSDVHALTELVELLGTSVAGYRLPERASTDEIAG
jgi:methyl-accepting chemotaxis protein